MRENGRILFIQMLSNSVSCFRASGVGESNWLIGGLMGMFPRKVRRRL